MGLIDRLRTRYKSLPAPVRAIVGRAAGLAPERLRFGGRYNSVRAEIVRASKDPEFAKSRQAELVMEQLIRCTTQSKHYRDIGVVNSLDTAASHSTALQFLAKMPVLSKEQVRAAPEAFLTKDKASLDIVTTSGSSGAPLTFYLDRDRSVIEWAFLLDAWSLIGFTPKDKRAALRGFEIPHVDEQPWEYEAGLRELRLSPFHMNDTWLPRYVEEITKRGIQFIHGYPSAIEILARFIEREGLGAFSGSIRGIILTSEAFYPHQADLFARVFSNAKTLSFYGLSEKVLFATSDVEDPTLFWFNPLYGVAELLDMENEAVVKVGQVGRIIGTGLQFKGMPFIRYDTGDMAELAELPGPSNGYSLGLRNIVPRRATDFLVGRDGELISMTALNIHSAAYSTMQSFLIEQDKPGEARVKAVLAPGHDATAVEAFVAEIGRKTGGNLKFTLEIVDDIPASARGKRNWIRQSLDIASLRGTN